MKALADCLLYGIVDLGYVSARNAVGIARQMIDGGVDILQLRAKSQSLGDIVALAKLLRPVANEGGAPFIINDFRTVAAAVGADGVHIGQDDGPIESAREIAGGVVGRSTHSVEQALAARDGGADYLGFGPLFATPTKPDYAPIGLEDIALAHRQVSDRPIFCIGGIKLENLPQIIDAGARRAVIVSGLLLADNVTAYARGARELLASAP